MVFLEVVIVIVGVGAEFQLLNLDDVLLFLGFVLLFLLLVLPLAKVHGFSDGRLGGGRDQYQVEPHILGFSNGRRSWHDLDGSVGKDRTHFSCAYRLVYVFSNFGPARREISGWIHAGTSGRR